MQMKSLPTWTFHDALGGPNVAQGSKMGVGGVSKIMTLLRIMICSCPTSKALFCTTGFLKQPWLSSKVSDIQLDDSDTRCMENDTFSS